MNIFFLFFSFLPAAVSLFLQAAAGAIWQIFIREGMVKNTQGSVLFYHMIGLCVFGYWYFAVQGTGLKETVKKIKETGKNCSILTVIGIFVLGMLLCVLGNSMVGMEKYLFPTLVDQYQRMMENAGMGTSALTVFASVAVAPIGEELLCRGVTLHYTKKITPSFHIANFFQALIFGLVHFNIIQGLYAFVIGLFLGCVREKYNSLLPAMFLHFAVNASSLFLLGGLLNRIPDTPVSWAACFVLSLAASVILLIIDKRPLFERTKIK